MIDWDGLLILTSKRVQSGTEEIDIVIDWVIDHNPRSHNSHQKAKNMKKATWNMTKIHLIKFTIITSLLSDLLTPDDVTED